MSLNTNTIYRFFAGEHTPQEADMIAEWIEADPKNKEEFDKAHKVFILSQMALNSGTVARMQTHREKRKARIVQIFKYAAIAAAAVIFGIVINYQFSTKPVEKLIENTMLVSEAKPGQRSDITLSDGTRIILNSGSRIEYPAIFRGKERRVTLDGEAMFNVERNQECPFIVETYAYDIKVLGTKFDVLACSRTQEFTTTLVEGKVAITDKSGIDRAILLPSQMVSLKDGILNLATVQNVEDALLWTNGILEVAGMPFDKLIQRLSRCYGVSIVLDRSDIPSVRYGRIKLRISDGIEFALDALQREADFEWKYDKQSDTYHIY